MCIYSRLSDWGNEGQGENAPLGVASSGETRSRLIGRACLKTPSKLFSGGNAHCSFRDGPADAIRIFVVGAIVQQSAVLSFSYPAPLLEEKRHSLFSALPADGDNPLPLHRTRSGTAFAADNHPSNPCQVN